MYFSLYFTKNEILVSPFQSLDFDLQFNTLFIFGLILFFLIDSYSNFRSQREYTKNCYFLKQKLPL